MTREQRLEILSKAPLKDFLKEIVSCNLYSFDLPAGGFLVHCPEAYNVISIADELKKQINDSINNIVEEIQNRTSEDNEFEGELTALYIIEDSDIRFTFRHCAFEEYGTDVELYDEIFEIGETISNILEETSKKYPGIEYEGLVCWTQVYSINYNSYTLLSNMSNNEYAKELILGDEHFWEDYEEYLYRIEYFKKERDCQS